MTILYWIGFGLLFFVFCGGDVINPVHEWINIEYDYPSQEARQNAIHSYDFIEGSSRISDVDVYYHKNNTRRIFITTPRLAVGVPATLGVVLNRTYNGNPIVSPYPSWKWNSNVSSCPKDRIVSVFRIMIDNCASGSRLWVLDSGFTPTYKCPPQLLAFDLETNSLVDRYEIPSSQLESTSVLAVVVADVRNPTCEDTFLYIGDTRGFAIIVYDVARRLSFRVSHRTMHASPDFGVMCIEGTRLELMDGIQGMAITPYRGRDRALFYHSLASTSENYIWTSIIRINSQRPESFQTFCAKRVAQSFPMAFNKDGILFFGLASKCSVNCWDMSTPYDIPFMETVYTNVTSMQYINGLKIIVNNKGEEELWLANTRAERLANGPSEIKIINFSVQSGNVDTILKKSKCRNSKKNTFISQQKDKSSCRFHADLCDIPCSKGLNTSSVFN